MMNTSITRRPVILLKRGNHSVISKNEDAQNLILQEGEVFLEYQDQYKDKWYEKLMNPVRIKAGDGYTIYKNLPFMNGLLKPIVKLCLVVGFTTIIQIACLIAIFAIL